MCMAIDAAIYVDNKIVELMEDDDSSEGDPLIKPKYSVDFYTTHKLLYYAQGIMLAEYKRRLFIEDIEAHACGPYIIGLRYLFKWVGGDPITRKLEQKAFNLTPDRRHVLDYVAKKYGAVDNDALIFETKKHSVYKDIYTTDEKAIIDENSLEKFFKENKKTLYPDFNKEIE